MRIIPSCLDVRSSSPSPVRLMCRSAREMLAPIVRSTSSCIDTSDPIAARVAHVQLDFLDRRHGLRNAVVGLLHLGEIGREQTSVLDVAEDELAAERGDPAVIREPVGDGRALVVVVDRDGIGEAVLLAAVQRRPQDSGNSSLSSPPRHRPFSQYPSRFIQP